jgi:hypothetical protein
MSFILLIESVLVSGGFILSSRDWKQRHIGMWFSNVDICSHHLPDCKREGPEWEITGCGSHCPLPRDSDAPLCPVGYLRSLIDILVPEKLWPGVRS